MNSSKRKPVALQCVVPALLSVHAMLEATNVIGAREGFTVDNIAPLLDAALGQEVAKSCLGDQYVTKESGEYTFAPVYIQSLAGEIRRLVSDTLSEFFSAIHDAGDCPLDDIVVKAIKGDFSSLNLNESDAHCFIHRHVGEFRRKLEAAARPANSESPVADEAPRDDNAAELLLLAIKVWFSINATLPREVYTALTFAHQSIMSKPREIQYDLTVKVVEELRGTLIVIEHRNKAYADLQLATPFDLVGCSVTNDGQMQKPFHLSYSPERMTKMVDALASELSS